MADFGLLNSDDFIVTVALSASFIDILVGDASFNCVADDGTVNCDRSSNFDDRTDAIAADVDSLIFSALDAAAT